jgi:hypothetical protein
VPSNKIVTAPNKKEKKICSKCKLITGVILVVLVAAAIASIVAVLMIGNLKGNFKHVPFINLILIAIQIQQRYILNYK